MRLSLVALWTVGCGFSGASVPDATEMIDSPVTVNDATSDALEGDAGPDAPTCRLWSPHHFDPCDVPAFQSSFVIDENATFDTTTGILVEGATQITVDSDVIELPAGNQVRVWSVIDLTIAQAVTLRVTGQHPLLIAAEGQIVVRGLIDAASRGTSRGGGSRVVPCSNLIDGASNDSGTGGGAGGSFRGRGGNGSYGDEDPGVAGGVGATPVPSPTEVRGGCDGGRGGPDTSSGTNGRAVGGLGGGAIQLSARLGITVSGVIHAGGGGGRGAPANTASGGGGGGSGGFVGLDAPSILVDGATLAANGGAGGGSAPFAGAGTAGGDAMSSTQPATCGASGNATCGIEGGPGSAGGMIDGTTVTATDICGGGGGGGGAGYILWWTSMPIGQVTASPSLEAGPP